MLSWIIQITLISIILIFLVHHLINFFKSTLTVPKIKDLVNTPTQKYENMYNIINNKNKNQLSSDINQNNDYTLIDLLPSNQNIPEEKTLMKNELKNFLKSQLRN
jgi:DNA-directed RNA polymerase sigma subunit (sigma70/sigma32)